MKKLNIKIGKVMGLRTLIYLLLPLWGLWALTSCTGSFEDYNKNPYGPTSEDMRGDNVETGVLIQAMIPAIVQGQQNNSQMIDQMIGLEYGGQAAMINPWGNSGNFYTLNPRVGWYGIPFTTTMPQIYSNFFQIKEKADAKGLVYAWAQILRVAASLKISDCYGPIPYSKITGVDYSVAYDDMETLYNAMFSDLDEAIASMKSAVASGADVSTLADFDYVFEGNFTNWIKYANTLKLRLAMRLVNADAALAQQKAEEAVSDNIGVMTEAGDAAYSSFNDGMNPFYRASYTWNGGEFRISASLTSYMNGYADPRLAEYATKSERNSNYLGVRNGIYQSSESFATYQDYSYPNIEQTDPLLIMSASEAYFLRAEGALRGWNMAGTAQELYEKGVNASMSEQGVSIGTYLTSTKTPADYTDPYQSKYSCKAQSAVTPKWNDADTDAAKEENLERIMIQKWIASYPNGWETWADVRRTGYPKLLPVADDLSGLNLSVSGPARLPYPQDEYNTNTANVEDAVKLLGGTDNMATKLWWAK